MPKLTQNVADEAAVHLLLIGETKAGKSTYVADAVVDGFNIILIDVDNGLSAMIARFNKEPNKAELFNRVNYFSPDRPMTFTRDVLRSTSKRPFLWLPNRQKTLTKLDLSSPQKAGIGLDEEVWCFDATKIPKSYIFVIDSWTALAADGLDLLNADQLSTLLSGEPDQSLYGEAGVNLTYIANMLQRLQCHVIVQAHPTFYERFEKPDGSVGNVKQREMKLVETIRVPISSSRPHGLGLGKSFNHIGNLEVSNLGAPMIDFTRHAKSVSGGPPNVKKKVSELRFKDLTSKPGVDTEGNAWYLETTVGKLTATASKRENS